MFALPGVFLLVICLLARPLDLFPALRGLPVLHLLAALALFGFVADLRVRFTELRFPRQFGWALCFMAWCMVTVAICAPAQLKEAALSLAITFLAYALLASGIQTFKALEWVMGGLLASALFIGVACIHLAQQPEQCVAYWPGETRLGDLGHPDGRPCQTTDQCIAGGDEVNAYSCEHAGWFGLTSVDQRVRYIGTLQDPNEVALFVSAALPLAFGFHRRRRTWWRAALVVFSTLLTCVTVYYTRSRGGQLVLLTVLGMCALQSLGPRRSFKLAVVSAAPLALLLAFAGDEPRADAEASTLKRLGCMLSGLEMFGGSPLVGVGFDQFTNHHEQTAHNSYVLAAAELGVAGLLLWSTTFYLAVKSVIVAQHTCLEPEAEVARVWGRALIVSLVGLAVGVFFLSFTYHYVLWIYLGLCGAFVSAIRSHQRGFIVPFGWRDLALVVTGASLILGAVLAYTKWKL